MEFKIIKKTPDYIEFEMLSKEPAKIENQKLGKVEIIVRENSTDSTVALKFIYRGQQYGNYVIVEKPTLTVAEVIEATNELLLWFYGRLMF